MKRITSLLLMLTALMSCFCLNACSKEPETVILTAENFYQYFDIESSIRNAGATSEYQGSDMYCIATATARIVLSPKFEGTWDDFKAEISWSVSDYFTGCWSFGSIAESRTTIERPIDSGDNKVCFLGFSAEYQTKKILVNSSAELSAVYELCPDITKPKLESISGVITVEKMSD